MYFIPNGKVFTVIGLALTFMTPDIMASGIQIKSEFTDTEFLSKQSSITTRSSTKKRLSETSDNTPSKFLKPSPVLSSPIKQQIFARTTYDSTAKYVLGNDNIRLDFIKTFTGLNVESSTPLDDSLNPLHRLTSARELFSNPDTKNFIAAIKENPAAFTVSRQIAGKKKKMEYANGSNFIREFSNYYKDVVSTFPKERASQVDVLCRLSDENYALVEIQVMKQTKWDERALFYASGVYSNQLPAGGKWDSLRKVYAVNILGGGPNNITYWGDEKNRSAPTPRPVRHYQFTDIYNKDNIISGIQLIQYSLGDADLDSAEFDKKQNLRNWLDFFKNAHRKNVIPAGISEELKRAYEMVRLNNLPCEVKDLYDQEKDDFEIYADHEKSVRLASEQKGREEGEKIGIEKGIELGEMRAIYKLIKSKQASKRLPEQIADALDISVEKINEIIQTIENTYTNEKNEEIL